MRKPTPKTMRKIKRRPKGMPLKPGIYLSDNIEMQTYTTSTGGRGSRVESLPPYGEYNPNRVHVARRRRAHKENNSFPRGWNFKFEEINEVIIGDGIITTIADALTVTNGNCATVTKTASDEWIVTGEDIS